MPAAMVSSWLFAGVFDFLLSRIGVDLRGPAYPAFVFPFVQLLPSGLAFSLVGALMASRSRVTTAIILAAICILLSLLQHVIGQSTPGLTNYMHATGESLGALVGVLYWVWQTRKPAG